MQDRPNEIPTKPKETPETPDSYEPLGDDDPEPEPLTPEEPLPKS